MKEYEYSFKVNDIKPFIEFCENNNYKKVAVTTQNRVVYENKHSENIIARITTKIIDERKSIVLDFKNVGQQHKELKISNESLPIAVTQDNSDALYSILEVLDFYVAANNDRTRYEYEKDGVLFEIDDYTNPKAQVVAIEGDKEKVDKVYEIIKKFL